MKWLEQRTKTWIRRLQRHARSWWYAPAVALLAFLDHFTIIIPTDGILVSAVMLHPRRWIYTFLIVSLGSSLGALALAGAIEIHGLPLLLKISPGLDQTMAWSMTEGFMNEYGALALFGIALSPVMQHPAVALAALAEMPLAKIFCIVMLGRTIKYGIICWVASHAPHLLRRLWGVRDELREVEEAAPAEVPLSSQELNGEKRRTGRTI